MDYTHTARSVEDRLLSYRKDESGWKTCKKTVSVHQNCVIFYSRWSINTHCVLFLEWCCGVLETLLWIRGICVSIHLWITLWSWLCHRDVICADFSSGINTRVRTVMKNLEKSWNFKTAFSRPGKVLEKWINPESFGKVMEIYFTNLCIIQLLYYSGPEFRYGIAHGLYRIFLLFPAAFEFKMMDIHTFIQ